MKMQTAGIPVGSPKPDRTQPTARNCCPSTVLLWWLRSPKKSRASFSNRGRRLPQSIRPTTVPEPDPIYPLLPLLFDWVLGNVRAIDMSGPKRKADSNDCRQVLQ